LRINAAIQQPSHKSNLQNQKNATRYEVMGSETIQGAAKYVIQILDRAEEVRILSAP
jgi:hypothetical protein